MATIKVGIQEVVVPDTLELESPEQQQVSSESRAERRAAFMLLFPDAQDPSRVRPVMGHQVYVLDTNRNNDFVHLAVYGPHKNFESDGGWFETNEIELWAYVPNRGNESKRRIPT